MLGLDDHRGMTAQHFAKSRQVKPVPLRTQRRQVLLRQAEQPHRWSQAAPMLRMGRMFKLLL
jgi:hypothetical protein